MSHACCVQWVAADLAERYAAAGSAHVSRTLPLLPLPPAGCLLAELVTRLPLFPGESDMDQLYLILKCFGRLSDQQMEWLRQHPV